MPPENGGMKPPGMPPCGKAFGGKLDITLHARRDSERVSPAECEKDATASLKFRTHGSRRLTAQWSLNEYKNGLKQTKLYLNWAQ